MTFSFFQHLAIPSDSVGSLEPQHLIYSVESLNISAEVLWPHGRLSVITGRVYKCVSLKWNLKSHDIGLWAPFQCTEHPLFALSCLLTFLSVFSSGMQELLKPLSFLQPPTFFGRIWQCKSLFHALFCAAGVALTERDKLWRLFITELHSEIGWLLKTG